MAHQLVPLAGSGKMSHDASGEDGGCGFLIRKVPSKTSFHALVVGSGDVALMHPRKDHESQNPSFGETDGFCMCCFLPSPLPMVSVCSEEKESKTTPE